MNIAASFYVLVLSISLTTNFFFTVNSKSTTSFSFTKFEADQPIIILQGDARTTNGNVTLTKAVATTAGRALYDTPINLWDIRTGDVANFTTSFTFVIDAPNSVNIADGLTFFIAPVDTKPQLGGGYLADFNSRDYNKTTQTVAIEFDTFHNEWDPSNGGRHIGINVNSIISKSTTPWNLQNNKQANVEISFNGATSVLTVKLTYPNSVSYTLSDVVPLKDIVPEWVRIGFSASTGAEYAAHYVLSWFFYSELGARYSSNQVAAA